GRDAVSKRVHAHWPDRAGVAQPAHREVAASHGRPVPAHRAVALDARADVRLEARGSGMADRVLHRLLALSLRAGGLGLRAARAAAARRAELRTREAAVPRAGGLR